MNITLLSDEELVMKVRDSDKELYSQIVNRYEKKLLNYAIYFLKNREEAKDVIQNSFIKAYVNLNGFDEKKKFSSWIYRIVHNEVMNSLNKRKKEISLEQNSWIERLLLSREDLEEIFDKKATRIKVNECLNELPLTYREPLLLFFLEDKSYDEISDILRMPISTVGTKINRAKKLMVAICIKKGEKL